MMRALSVYGWFIGLNRIVLAALFYFISTEVIAAPYEQYLSLLSAGYLLISIVFVAACMASWTYEFASTPYLICIDIAVFFCALIISLKFNEPTFLFSLICMSNICIIIYDRFGMKKNSVLSLWLVASFFFIIFFMNLLSRQFLILETTTLLSILFVATISIWFGINNPRINVSRFLPQGFDSNPNLAESVLEYAQHNFGGAAAVLCWLEPENIAVRALKTGKAGAMEEIAPASYSAPRALRNMPLMVFDLADDYALRLDENGHVVRAVITPSLRVLLEELDCHKGISIPFEFNQSENACLIMADLPTLNWRGLRLGQKVREELGYGLVWHASANRERSYALEQLSRAIAADLHDSVAHSLAGARFLLASLRKRPGDAAASDRDIQSIESALGAEQLHIRSLIDQLRAKKIEVEDVNFIADLRRECRLHETRWACAINFVLSDFRIMLPMWYSLQLQQLVRETISNGVRHSSAPRFEIECRKSGNAILINISSALSDEIILRGPFKPKAIIERLGELGGTLQLQITSSEIVMQMRVPTAALVKANRMSGQVAA